MPNSLTYVLREYANKVNRKPTHLSIGHFNNALKTDFQVYRGDCCSIDAIRNYHKRGVNDHMVESTLVLRHAINGINTYRNIEDLTEQTVDAFQAHYQDPKTYDMKHLMQSLKKWQSSGLYTDFCRSFNESKKRFIQYTTVDNMSDKFRHHMNNAMSTIMFGFDLTSRNCIPKEL